MGRRQIGEPRLGRSRQPHQHAPAIRSIMPPPHQARRLQPVHQFHHAVVPDPHPLRELADRRLAAARKPLDRQQRLVLARGQAGRARRKLAELQEAPDQVTELRQAAVILLVGPRRCSRRIGQGKAFRVGHRRLRGLKRIYRHATYPASFPWTNGSRERDRTASHGRSEHCSRPGRGHPSPRRLSPPARACW